MSDDRTGHADQSERDTPMTATYVKVLVFEALIMLALFLFGRMFA